MRVFTYFAILILLACIALYKVGDDKGWWDKFKLSNAQVSLQINPSGLAPQSPPQTNEWATESRLPSPLEDRSEVNQVREAKELYLTDLPILEVKTIDDSYSNPTRVKSNTLITSKGREYLHSIHFTKRPDGIDTPGISAEFNLGGKFNKLEFGFGYDDNHASAEEGARCSLSVLGDGRTLWESSFISPNDFAVFQDVDVSGVFRLKLVVTRILYDREQDRTEYENKLSPAVLDPLLRK